MSNKKKSLEANQEEILASLPGEFQEDFKSSSDGATTAGSSVNDKTETSAIKAELVANPSVDESAASGELKDIDASK